MLSYPVHLVVSSSTEEQPRCPTNDDIKLSFDINKLQMLPKICLSSVFVAWQLCETVRKKCGVVQFKVHNNQHTIPPSTIEMMSAW